NASTSQLSWPPEGPWGTVSRTPDVNLTYWKDDMNALYNLARMWYFTGNTNYAQKAHDIILAWANTQTNFGGHETALSLGDFAVVYAGGADILRGTWPGWTEADTIAVKNYFENVTWPATIAGFNTTGPANKGMLSLEAGIAIAAFCDDTNKFNHCIEIYRTSPASGLFNTLPIGEMGETGRDEGHSYGTLLGMAVISEIAWKQGIDLYSDLDNRLLACGEYYARNSLVLDNPFVPFGTIDYNYYANNPYYFTPDSSAFAIIQNAYKNRLHLPTPWIDLRLQSLGGGGNLMYSKTADFSTATPPPAVVRPPVSLASSGLTLTTLGSQTAGRSVSYANGVWTLTGLGNSVWTGTGGADDCQFAYQAM
ncbi:MAG TPA: alginate lyase family protein, partial [Candidatus Binatia bacterium]|nr:alginate lyase family protein [Candidatus Binatia bacterium]